MRSNLILRRFFPLLAHTKLFYLQEHDLVPSNRFPGLHLDSNQATNVDHIHTYIHTNLNKIDPKNSYICN